MRPGITLVLALAALLAPAAAHAYTTDQLDRWQNIAAAQWAGAPCNGRYHANVVQTLGPSDQAGRTLAGQANIGDSETCTYTIVDGLDDYTACVVVVHEAGHLYGLEHTPGGIMDPVPASAMPFPDYKPCAVGDTEITLSSEDAFSWVDARWAMNTLDCRRDQIPSRQRCWGTSAAGRHLRFTVWRGERYRVHGGRWK